MANPFCLADLTELRNFATCHGCWEFSASQRLDDQQGSARACALGHVHKDEAHLWSSPYH